MDNFNQKFVRGRDIDIVLINADKLHVTVDSCFVIQTDFIVM